MEQSALLRMRDESACTCRMDLHLAERLGARVRRERMGLAWGVHFSDQGAPLLIQVLKMENSIAHPPLRTGTGTGAWVREHIRPCVQEQVQVRG